MVHHICEVCNLTLHNEHNSLQAETSSKQRK